VIRARVGPFTPVEPRVSVDAIVILRRFELTRASRT
jgi:hypothetical protein